MKYLKTFDELNENWFGDKFNQIKKGVKKSQDVLINDINFIENELKKNGKRFEKSSKSH